jgi:hypothetical protein
VRLLGPLFGSQQLPEEGQAMVSRLNDQLFAAAVIVTWLTVFGLTISKTIGF